MTAIRFVNSVSEGGDSNLWLVLGKETPWTSDDGEYGMDGINPPSDSNPPVATSGITATSFTPTEATPYVAFQATASWLVEDDEDGTLTVRDASTGSFRFFNIIAEEATAITDLVILIALQGTVYGDQMPYSSFRAIGFVTDLVPADGHSGDTYLVAANVSSWGHLETIEYRSPASVISGDGYTTTQIIRDLREENNNANCKSTRVLRLRTKQTMEQSTVQTK